MPEIKNTFLGGKMNKSLDDRLLPEGEYRDALNVQITKSEGSDVGAIQNIKGNLNLSNLGLAAGYEVIGSCFDDQKNEIYWFVTNNTNSYLYKYSKGDETTTAVLSDAGNAKLNFNKSNRIQANIIEDYLFFTDNRNEPRKIDTTENYSSFAAVDLTVAKIAPQFAPAVEVLDTDLNNSGNYIEEKFVRFAYRYKFSDNTYSVYSPFSNIVFALNSDVLTESQIQDAYSKGEIDVIVNTAKTISIQPKDPVGNTTTWSAYGIEQIDILMKASDSPAVLLLDSLKGSDLNSAFTYNSEKPKATLPENQLIRVYDEVPKKAVAQEIVGNRVVYGNFTQGFNIDATAKLPFTLTTTTKEINSSYLDYLGVKSNRTYEIGLVFSDDYGRTSPVVFGNNKTVYLDKLVQSNYNKQLAIQFNDPLDLTAITDAGFKYYSVVVKQSEQEYYNVYTPGFGSVNGRSYFSLFGDNINKIPIDTSTYNFDTNINTTSTKVYLSVENKALSDATTSASSGATLEAFEYSYDFEGPVESSEDGFINNITNVVAYTNGTDFTQSINGEDCTIGKNKLVPSGLSTDGVFEIQVTDHSLLFADTPGNGYTTFNTLNLSLTENTGVDVYVDGVKKVNSIDFLYAKNIGLASPTITFTEGNIPEAGQQIAVFFKYGFITVSPPASGALLSLTSVYGSTTVEQLPGSYLVSIPTGALEETLVAPTTPLSYRNLEEIKITGISIRNNFGPLADSGVIATNSAEDLEGIYKVDNGYLLVEVDGLYGVPFYNATGPVLKQADLAILETKGFESAIDIYYETATQGTIDSLTAGAIIPINYFNCINLKAPARGANSSIVWQESRIKGAYNAPSMDYGVQAYFANEDYAEIQRTSSLIYSGILNNNTRVNNTNQFPSGENITRTLDPSYGSIQKLYADTEDLLIFQEEKVSQALIDKDIIYTAEGQGLTTAGANVISQINSYGTNYGIGTNPESFAVYAGRKYFVDKPKGAVLRLSRDGITEISNYGLRSYFRDVLSGDKTGIIGSYDIYNKEYVLSIQGTSVKWQDEEIGSITLGYDESNNGWTSRYSYIPEAGGSLDGSFYTFKQGELYIHNALKDLEQNYVYNTFYGAAYPSEVELVFNQNPSSSKNFLTINYEGTDTWNIIDIITDTDSAENITSYNINNEDLIISSFKKYDNKYYSNLFNKTTANNNEVVFGNSISGIKGYFAKMKIKTDATAYKELFSVSTNYNINSY